MPTVQVPAQLTVEHLMAAVKQFSPDELHEFKQQFAAWQGQNGEQTVDEARLIQIAPESSRTAEPTPCAPCYWFTPTPTNIVLPPAYC